MNNHELARGYFGGLVHVHTFVSNHIGHIESNLTLGRILSSLQKHQLAGSDDSPITFISLNEHTSDSAFPRRLSRFSLRQFLLSTQTVSIQQSGIPVVYGLEVSMLADGGIDATDQMVQKRPFVISSRHRLPKRMQYNTESIHHLFRQNCDNPAVVAIGHPARNIEGVDTVDWPMIFAYAAETGTAIEINYNNFPPPKDKRRTFWEHWLRLLGDSEAAVIIGTDIHNKSQLNRFIRHWKSLDKPHPKRHNLLADFITTLQVSNIKTDRIISNRLDRLQSWLEQPKADRKIPL